MFLGVAHEPSLSEFYMLGHRLTATTHNINQHERGALAHLGERQTEVNFRNDIWRHCVRSTEASSVTQGIP